MPFEVTLRVFVVAGLLPPGREGEVARYDGPQRHGRLLFRVALLRLRVGPEADLRERLSGAPARLFGVEMSVVPSVTRRCFIPSRYCAIQARLPPARTRRPKAGKS